MDPQVIKERIRPTLALELLASTGEPKQLVNHTISEHDEYMKYEVHICYESEESG